MTRVAEARGRCLHPARRAVACCSVAVLVAVVMLLGGCGQLDVVEGLTPEQAQAETARLVDEAIGKIDPALIKRIDDVTDGSGPCYGSDVDSRGHIRAWDNSRYVWLVDGAQQLDVANPIIQSYLDGGWQASYDRDSNPSGGRVVQLVRGDGVLAEIYGLRISVHANESVIDISATSPCFNDPSR